MSHLDYAVLFGTLLAITLIGVWKTRSGGSLSQYLKGDEGTRWGTIGLSVLATQASAITFLSTPGQAYEDGLGFVQNYFGQPLALIVVCVLFIPAFQRLKVYTAYEYLGERFDRKTRLLGASLFLVQRGLATGITIYAPAIIISALVGWNLDLTILLAGGLAVLYTVTGGARAVNMTQTWQLAVIFVGMCAAFAVVVSKLPADVSFVQAVRVAGKMGRLGAVDLSFSPERRYTLWSGLLGGFFLALSYFGADQTQVQRYLAGGSVTKSRFGLLFNGIVKVPMQCFILFIGAMVFVFYQFEPPPIAFNRAAYQAAIAKEDHVRLDALRQDYDAALAARRTGVDHLLSALRAGDGNTLETARREANAADARVRQIRADTRQLLTPDGVNGKKAAKDSDFIFLTFVLDHLPHGLIGLLLAVIFCAAMSAAAAGLGGLASTTVVDFYRPLLRPEAPDAHYLLISRLVTAGWGVIAVGFALFARLVENLIEAGNILGSLFYGSILGLFLTAFLLPAVRGSAAFTAALLSQALVLGLYAKTDIGYLWYNVIGCAGVMLLGSALQKLVFSRTPEPAS